MEIPSLLKSVVPGPFCQVIPLTEAVQSRLSGQLKALLYDTTVGYDEDIAKYFSLQK